jgi:hypothetical protein
MKNLLKSVAAAAALVTISAPAYAIPFEFNTVLLGSNEFPPVATPATGSAKIIFDPAAHTMSVHVEFTGLIGNTTASHIHCCLPAPFATGVNAGVATTTPTFAGFPLGVTSGVYDNTLDMTLATSYNPSFVTAHGGLLDATHVVAQVESDLFNGILAGKSYLNVHSSFATGGEVRGFLVFVPEPATLAVVGFGLLGLRFGRRKPKQN